jgi:hypothetical protein
MDIHPAALKYGQDAARAEGWSWAGYCGDLRDLHLLGPAVADVVLSCYALAYLDPRDIDAVLAAALACATTALILCEPGEGTSPEVYLPPGPTNVAEYQYDYRTRLEAIPGWTSMQAVPITPPHGRLNAVLTVTK